MDRKKIFDAVRDILGRGFTTAEVRKIDRAIDEALGAQQPNLKSLKTSDAGTELIHSFEGYAQKLRDGSAKAYPDPATGGKPWTIGWGSTTDEYGNPIEPGTVWSRERANHRFKLHMQDFEAGVIEALDGAETSQSQFDALVSFAYNVGVANLKRSTLLKKHKAGDFEGAAEEFKRWNRANGRVMRGLTRRREAEAKMYRGEQ